MTTQLDNVIQRAHIALYRAHPRAEYAHKVIDGRQRWSGADLKGKAKKFSGSYYRQRRHATAALFRAGGCIVALRQTGKLVTACQVGQDDFGAQLYATKRGTLTADQLR